VTLPPARIVLPAALASLLAMIVGLGLLRTAARFFEAYVIAVIAIGSIILLALDKAALINESAIAAVAYFPPLIFAAAFALAIWQLKEKGRTRQAGGETTARWQSQDCSRLPFISKSFREPILSSRPSAAAGLFVFLRSSRPMRARAEGVSAN